MNKSIILRFVLAVFVTLAFWVSVNSQCACIPGGTSKILLPGEVKTISSLFPSGSSFASGYCFSLSENSQLIIDKDFLFSGCSFWQKSGSKIIVNPDFTATFDNGCNLEDCSGSFPGSNGIILEENAGINARWLTIQGNGTMSSAITGNIGSKINLYSPQGQTAIFNIGETYAVNCKNCNEVRLDNVSMSGCIAAIWCTGAPNLRIENSSIQSSLWGIYCGYSQGASPTLFMDDVFVNIGNGIVGGSYSGIHLEYLTTGTIPLSFATSPVTGGPAIKNCTVFMNATPVGFYFRSLSGVNFTNNTAQMSTFSGNTSADTRLMTFGYCQSMSIVDNKAYGNASAPIGSTQGLTFSSSPGCSIINNTIRDVSYGVTINDNCSTPNGFSGNQFNGSQYIGLRLAQGATLGDQECMANKWNGTFSLLGAQNLSVVAGNTFIVKTPFLPDMPSTNVPFWFQANNLCPQFGGGEEGESRSNEGVAFTPSVDSKVSVCPNPASSRFEVFVPKNQSDEYLVELTDLAGKLVISTITNKGAESMIIYTDGLSPGIYLVRVSNERIRHVEKIVITK